MTTLLQTKLTIPTTRPSLVVRARLLQRLDDVRHNKLVLVSAPAGFGKTTLIATYGAQAAAKADTAVAWLSLDADDDDPVRFGTYFMAALAAAGVSASLDETAVANTPPDLLMTEVVNAITAVLAPQPDTHLILVLDDYHLIHNRAIHEAITFLLEHMPPQMHLMLATRADPPLPLARWRARSQLVELRLHELRFTEAEAAGFLRQVMGLDLSAANIAALNERTEGWIAGLQMAAVSLQGRSDTAGFVQSFSGSHRYILDYLMEEVLSRQPEEMTQFLLQTAVLKRLCAPLCDTVLGTGQSSVSNLQSQTILEQLETRNLFLLPLDDERRWYRYHRLFVDLLRQRLAQTQPAQIPILHERAAVWFEANDFPEEAIGHALLAGATDMAARLIACVAEAMLMRSELVTLMRWLAALPPDELAQRPSLGLYYAWCLIMEGRAQVEIEMALQHVTAEGAPGELSLVRSLLVLFRGDGTTAVHLARQALSQLAPDQTFLRGVSTWVLGLALLFRGDLEAGVQTLEDAVQISQQVGNMTIAAVSLGRLASQAFRAGDLHRAKRIHQQALVLATDEAERPLPIAGEAHIGLGRIYYEWNELETAVEHIETGLALTERWRSMSAIAGTIWLAHIRHAQGDSEAANQALERARKLAYQSEGTQLDDMAVAVTEASLRLLEGDIAAAAAWCAERHIPQEIDVDALQQHDNLIEGHFRKYEFVILARLQLAQQRPDDVLALLHPLLVNAQRLQRHDLQIEIHILTALAYQQKGEVVQADHHCQAALGLGEPGGFVRLFVEAGPGVADLLKRQKVEGKRQIYVQALLAACGQAPATAQSPASSLQSPSPLVEPLSERELEVLTLIADGLSNREIAAELVLSLPTIKWHTSNIYGKLGVGNRVTAVARARELHILP
jgi:LuxR family transcriptional regulator, maltose regulon positive regulatory protein